MPLSTPKYIWEPPASGEERCKQCGGRGWIEKISRDTRLGCNCHQRICLTCKGEGGEWVVTERLDRLDSCAACGGTGFQVRRVVNWG